MYGIYGVRRRNHQVEGALEEVSEGAERQSRWERTYCMDRSERGSNAPFESKKATDYVRVVKDDVGGPSLQEGREPLMRKTGERTCWPSRPGVDAWSAAASERGTRRVWRRLWVVVDAREDDEGRVTGGRWGEIDHGIG